MTTKQEIITGMEEVIAQARRVSTLLEDQGDWDMTRPAGWTPKEMFCHLASVSGLLATTGPGLLAAPEDADFTASTNIADLNAQAVASMSEMTPQQLAQAVETNYGKAIEWGEEHSGGPAADAENVRADEDAGGGPAGEHRRSAREPPPVRGGTPGRVLEVDTEQTGGVREEDLPSDVVVEAGRLEITQPTFR